jgi:hypothetical protein
VHCGHRARCACVFSLDQTLLAMASAYRCQS